MLTKCGCFGSGEPGRRAGLSPLDYPGNRLLGLLGVEALEGLDKAATKRLAAAGFETLVDVAAADPLTLLIATTLPPAQALRAHTQARIALAVRPDPEVVALLGGRTVAEVLETKPAALAKSLGTARGVLPGALADFAALGLTLRDAALNRIPVVALCFGGLFCLPDPDPDLEERRCIAELMDEAARKLQEGKLKEAIKIQEEIERRLRYLIERLEKDEQGGGQPAQPGGGQPAQPGGTPPPGGPAPGGATPGGAPPGGGAAPKPDPCDNPKMNRTPLPLPPPGANRDIKLEMIEVRVRYAHAIKGQYRRLLRPDERFVIQEEFCRIRRLLDANPNLYDPQTQAELRRKVGEIIAAL